MKVAYKNPNKPVTDKPQYRCNICEKWFSWTKESGYHEKPIDKGLASYEIQFYICSNDCRSKPETEKKVNDFYKRTS